MIKNLCTFLCQDVSRTPIFASAKNKSNGILTLEYKPARGTVGKESKESTIISEEVATAKLVYRGAQLALSQLAERFGADLLERVPKLWNCMSDALVEIFGSGAFLAFFLFFFCSFHAEPATRFVLKATSRQRTPFSPVPIVADKISSIVSPSSLRGRRKSARAFMLGWLACFLTSPSQPKASSPWFDTRSLAASPPFAIVSQPKGSVTSWKLLFLFSAIR